MMWSGDEVGHSQSGSNNAYCQDNELTWVNWDLSEEQTSFLNFVRKATLLWRTQPVFQRRRFFQGRGIRGSEIKDISWIDPSGNEMSDDAWNADFVRSLGVRFAGDLIGDTDDRGEPIVGETLLMLLNAHHDGISFTLPLTREEHRWQLVLDTANPDCEASTFEGKDHFQLTGRSLALFRIVSPQVEQPLSAIQIESLIKDEWPLPVHSGRPALATPP